MRVLTIFVSAMLILAFAGCKGCKQPKDENVYQKEIRSLEEKLQILQREREADSLLIVELNEKNEELVKQDSILRISLKSNSSKINEIKKGYAKTNRFNNYQSADILRYFTDSLK